jgi:putative ABC transport system permease protein
MLNDITRDVRQAARSLRSRPTYALVTIITLALVVGAASGVLAVVNATMIRPLPFPDGDRLVQLFSMPPGVSGVTNRNPLHPRVFHRFRGQLTQLDHVDGIWARERALGGDLEPESVAAGAVSAGFFTLMGKGPIIGRTFSEEEDRDNAKVVVLSFALWQRRFGGDARVLGRIVQIDRESHEVIGVMPRDFRPAYVPSEFWTPLNASGQLDSAATFVQTFAHLPPGVTVPQVEAELGTVMPGVINEAPNTLKGWTPEISSLRDAQFGQRRATLLVLLAGAIALVLIACANLANLTLAQIVGRRSEIALRTALGAGHAAVVRLQVIETFMLVGVGSAAGVVLGAWTLPVLLALDPTTSRALGDVAIDWRVQAATALVALAVTIFAGVFPLARELGGDTAPSLAEGNRRAAGSRRHDRLRHLLVAAEAAMAVVLLVCGALLFSAFERTSRVDPGFDPRGVLGAQLRLSATAYATEAARTQFISRVLERVRAIPGVTAAGTTLNQFVPGFAFVTLVKIDGKPTPDGQAHTVQFRRISPGYFNTLRIPLLRGRDFHDGDGASAPLVAIVSRSFADRFWPHEDALGRRIERGAVPRFYSVVGIVDDVSDAGFGQAPAPTIYLMYAQSNVAITPTSLVVRTDGDPNALTHAVRAAILSVDRAQPLANVTTLDQFLADSLGPQRFRSMLLAALGALALALAAVGIYGVTARAVEERTRELGVRLALGATPGGVVLLVVRQALRSVGIGVAAGVLLAAAAAQTLLQTLPGLERAEAWAAGPAVALLAVVAAAAAAIPARRAVALDPTTALRS